MKGPMNSQKPASNERETTAVSGWVMFPLNILLLLGDVALLRYSVTHGDQVPLGIVGILVGLAGLVMLGGYFTLQPNEARLLLLFGQYKGTVRQSGFHWVNPFYSHAQRQKYRCASARSPLRN